MLLKSEYSTVKLRRLRPSARSPLITLSLERWPEISTSVRLRPGAHDLQVALVVAAAVGVAVVADDGDQAVRVLALAVVLVAADDLLGRDRRAAGQRLVGVAVGLLVQARAARIGVGRLEARLLLVDARQHRDPGVVLGLVHRRLDVAEAALLEQLQVRPAHLLGLGRALDLLDPLVRVGLAHHQPRAVGARGLGEDRARLGRTAERRARTSARSARSWGSRPGARDERLRPTTRSRRR